MVYAFATLLGFNTDSKLYMREIFRIHGLKYPESSVVGRAGTAAHIYAVNEALEVYLRFRNNEFVTGGRGGRVWSESLKALQPYERYAINEHRVTALVKFSRRISRRATGYLEQQAHFRSGNLGLLPRFYILQVDGCSH